MGELLCINWIDHILSESSQQPIYSILEAKLATTDLINPSSFLLTETLTVENFLTGGHYNIPDYQRDYSWSEDQVKDLWTDIKNLQEKSFLANGNICPNPQPHFIGALVLQSFSSASSAPPEIMDGQQRLVTISIIISVLIEFADNLSNSSNAKLYSSALQSMLFTTTTSGIKKRISLARDDNHYNSLVCERFKQADRQTYRTSHSSDKSLVFENIFKASLYIYNDLTTTLSLVPPANQDQYIIQTIKTICQLVVALKMAVLEQGSAYEIFESLNARGLELQQADLIKNKLFSLAQAQGSKPIVTPKWEAMVRSIEKQTMVTLTEYLYFDFIVKHHATGIKQTNLYSEIKKHLESGAISALDYINSASDTADGLQQTIENGATVSASERNIEAITDTYKNQYALTLWIAGLKRHQIGSPEYASILELTNKYVFRRFIIENIKPGSYATEITSLARTFAMSTTQTISELTNELRLKSSDRSFRRFFKDYKIPNNKIGFYIIETIENWATKGKGVTLQRQSPNQHLEHIMPKKPGSAWSHLSGNIDYPEYVDRIGNLLVLEANINQSIKNKDYSYKKTNATNLDYVHSKTSLPAYLPKYEYISPGLIWDFESIEKRQRDLTVIANKVWSFK